MNSLVLALDDNYVLQLKVLWHSLYRTGSLPPGLQVFILHEQSLSPASITALSGFFSLYDCCPSFVDTSNHVPDSLPMRESDHVSRATFYRLYMPSLLPQYVQTAVYLDVDTLAIDSLRDIFSVSIGDAFLAAVDHFSPQDELRLWGAFGGTYFNAGVLILNLQKWREHDVERQFAKIMIDNASNILWWDQDVLNIAFKDKWLRVPFWYNLHHTILQITGLPVALANTKLIHYTGATKPWNNPQPSQHELLWHQAVAELNEYVNIGGLITNNPSLYGGVPVLFESRKDMLASFIEDDMVVAEIGVFKGDFSEYILSLAKLKMLFIVDLFDGVVVSGDQDGNNVREANMDDVHRVLAHKYRSTPSVTVFKGSSNMFFQSLEDNSLDLVYIDGDHSFEGCRSDLENAFKKVRNNGYILGHDYSFNPLRAKNAYEFGVKKAVDQFCVAYGQSIAAKAMDGCISYAIRVVK